MAPLPTATPMVMLPAGRTCLPPLTASPLPTTPLAIPPATSMALAGTLPGSYDYLGQKVKVKYYDIYVDKATGQLAIFQKSTGKLVVITDYFT